MSSKMSSIRSVLIRTSMANIQKEISQLEHWLINLPDDVSSTTSFQNTEEAVDGVEMDKLYRVINKLSEQIENQQNTLSNIIDRLDSIENGYNTERNVHINDDNSPWVDGLCEPLCNEIISGSEEQLLTIHKDQEGDNIPDNLSVKTPSIVPNIPDDTSVIPDIVSEAGDTLLDTVVSVNTAVINTSVIVETPEVINTPVITNDKKEVVEQKVEVEKEKEVEVEEKKEKKVEENKVEEEEEEVEEEEEEEEEEEVEQEEEEVEEEEVEEEEVEDGLELEEIDYNGKKYYKDAENFIYTILDDEQPSENPIGYWKEKTNTIAFYKTK